MSKTLSNKDIKIIKFILNFTNFFVSSQGDTFYFLDLIKYNSPN